jgi:hypothetical protein
LAQRRRNRDLDGYRDDERQRQADRRERLRTQGHQQTGKGEVSRAILSPQKAILRAEIIESWDRQQELSRARFERRVRHLLGRSGKKLGQAETGFGDCHVPP